MQLSPVRPRPRPPSGATEAAAQRERGASDRNREDTSRLVRRTDGDDDDSFADQNTYKQLSARLRP